MSKEKALVYHEGFILICNRCKAELTLDQLCHRSEAYQNGLHINVIEEPEWPDSIHVIELKCNCGNQL